MNLENIMVSQWKKPNTAKQILFDTHISRAVKFRDRKYIGKEREMFGY